MPIVAIVGRPNVGKSTLFNRLCRQRRALVDEAPGVTRDRIIAQTTWEDRTFCLVDTGGIEEIEAEDSVQAQVRQQAQAAVEEADLIIFLADGKQGFHPGDSQVVDLLRRSGKPVLYAVNKIDGVEKEANVLEFYQLGVEKLFPISAAHGYGVRDFMDSLVASLPQLPEEEHGTGKDIRVAILGRPNVGKSSLLNRILGTDRVVVSEVPGTTRDIIDVVVEAESEQFVLIDTPGIRRRSKTREKLEKFSVIKALRSIQRCDVAVLLIDATQGLAAQDIRIAGYVHENRRGAVLVINKWDMIHNREQQQQVCGRVKEGLRFMPYAPILRLSALTGKGVSRLLPAIASVFQQYSLRVPTAALNEVLATALKKHQPPRYKGTRLKIYYGTQAAIRPPTFVLFVNRPEGIHFSYRRYLTNQIRQAFKMDRTPIRLVFRGRQESRGQ
ncbi:MAG: ribosome biogenesis GTPase Der [Deltaproteobacteria bacterium]|nr:ribosome biogenesis GTPase Der [Deltaproteobacteria bacterium]MBW2070161.1 ribosome biogenesis GTPase Der [Deltaproteobacteria bacterium]